MARKIFAGPTPDGSYIQRQTDNDYTHAVTILDDREKAYVGGGKYAPNPKLGKYVSLSWHRTHALATKNAQKFAARGERVAVVPVIDGTPPSPIESKEDTMSKRSTPNTRKARTTAGKVTAKSQGFPACYLGPNGNFAPGMDARAKSDLRAAVTGKATSPVKHKFAKATAQKLLAARGW